MKFDITFFTTIVLPIASIIVSILIYFFQKTKKQISYQVMSSISLPTYDKPLDELMHPNKELIIEYTNKGNTALVTSDFNLPIKTSFPNAKIIFAKKYYPANNPDIEFEIVNHEYSATFTPDLLNPGESVFLQFYVSGFHNKVHVSSRIINGKNIYNKAFRANLIEKVSIIFVMYFLALISNIYKTGNVLFIESGTNVLLLSGVFLFWFIKDYRKIKKNQYN